MSSIPYSTALEEIIVGHSFGKNSNKWKENYKPGYPVFALRSQVLENPRFTEMYTIQGVNFLLRSDNPPDPEHFMPLGVLKDDYGAVKRSSITHVPQTGVGVAGLVRGVYNIWGDEVRRGDIVGFLLVTCKKYLSLNQNMIETTSFSKFAQAFKNTNSDFKDAPNEVYQFVPFICRSKYPMTDDEKVLMKIENQEVKINRVVKMVYFGRVEDSNVLPKQKPKSQKAPNHPYATLYQDAYFFEGSGPFPLYAANAKLDLTLLP